MSLESSKLIGGIGLILFLLALPALFLQPLVTIVLGIVGAILLLVALHSLADYYKEHGIFNNGLAASILLIVGGVTTFAAFVYLVFYTSTLTDILTEMYTGYNGDLSTLPNLTLNQNINYTHLATLFIPILAIFIIMEIFAILSSFCLWRSLKIVSVKSSVGLFSTGSILLLVGALLAIVVIGIILMWIAMLLILLAFFQLKPSAEQSVVTSLVPTAPASTTV